MTLYPVGTRLTRYWLARFLFMGFCVGMARLFLLDSYLNKARFVPLDFCDVMARFASLGF
jgi:hypothetical protein